MVKDDDLDSDPLLFQAPKHEGFKVLEPAVLYAKVGQGGMGAVYRGRHFSLECDVAVKVLKPDLARDEQFVLRFEREARLAARIKNDNVVQVLDVKKKNGIHYLVMEYVRGETARERVQRKGKLAEQEALAIVLGAARGLRAAHQEGIVHRDLKPDNVLIGSDGAVKVSDLGLAKQKRVSGEQSMTMLSSGVMGTPQYMPPEQWKSADVKASADVWALGATLWYLLAGRSAIANGELLDVAERIRGNDFPDLGDVRPDVRPEVRALIGKCTRRDPEQRFADARELLAALKPLCGANDEVAADEATGTSKRVGTVTPPPRSTLAKIKVQVESQQTPATLASEQPTIPSLETPTVPQAPGTQPGSGVLTPTSTGSPPQRSRRGWLAVLLLLVLVGGTGAYGANAGWLAPPPITDPAVNKPPAPASPNGPVVVAAADAAQARVLLQRGEQSLAVKGGLDDAIDAFQQAVGLDGTLDAAKRGLVTGLARKAKDLEANDLDGAWDRIMRAQKVLPGDAGYRDVEARVVAALRQRIVATVKLDSPAPLGVQGRREVAVRGSITATDVQSVRVLLAPLAGAKAPFPAGIAPVGLLQGDFESTLTAGGDGPFVVRVQIEDTRGLFAEIEPRGLVVDTTAPVVEITTPKAGEFVGARGAVSGTVTDATKCTVAVATTAGTVTGDSWSAEVALAEGEQRVLVVAKDAAGNEGSASVTVRVDSEAPRINFAFDLAKVTKEPQFAIRGVVVDAGGGVATLRADGEPAAIAGEGSFVFTKRFTEQREYEVVFIAVDAAKNEATGRFRIRYDATPPVLEWRAPTASTVEPGDVEVSGTVTDATTCIVQVDGKPATVDGDRWNAKVRVAAEASVTVQVTARDVAGNPALPISRTLRGADPVVKLTWGKAAADAKLVTIDGKKYPSIVVEERTGMRMVLVPAGVFMMGSPSSEPERDGDETQHRRVIRKPFWLGETEVSQAQWKAVMGGANPSSFKDDQSPVEHVSWNDCQDFVRAMNAGGKGFRLPSEAEWEYACRAGTTTRFSFGPQISTDRANFGRQRTVAVGSFAPNAFGLYQMHGNVWEWCEDTKADYPGSGTEEPTRGEGLRVCRGGSWVTIPRGCRSAARIGSDPRDRGDRVGFRLARTW